jgi:hypothetical protein
MQRTALAQGVPPAALLIEPNSRDTLGNSRETTLLLRAHRLRSVVLVGKLAGGRRAQKERQDEQPASERDQDLRRHLRRRLGAVGDHQNQRILDRVVVERRQKLRPEQRPETARRKQRQYPRRSIPFQPNRRHRRCLACSGSAGAPCVAVEWGLARRDTARALEGSTSRRRSPRPPRQRSALLGGDGVGGAIPVIGLADAGLEVDLWAPAGCRQL